METSRSSPEPTREEAAALIAAVERFLRDTTPARQPAAAPTSSSWKRAALAEGISRQPDLFQER